MVVKQRSRAWKDLIELFNRMDKGWNIRQINKELFTYAHTVELIQHFERVGFITSEVSGRNKYIRLTDKGRACAAWLNSGKSFIDDLMNKSI